MCLDCGTVGIPDPVWKIHLAACRLEREEEARFLGKIEEEEGGTPTEEREEMEVRNLMETHEMEEEAEKFKEMEEKGRIPKAQREEKAQTLTEEWEEDVEEADGMQC